MSPEREKLVLEELSKRVREEIKFNNSPVSLAWLADRINEIQLVVEIDPSDDFSEFENFGYQAPFPIRKRYSVSPNQIRNIIFQSDKDLFYETKSLIGLYSQYQKLLYDLIFDYLSSKSNSSTSLDEVVNFIIKLGQEGKADLPDYSNIESKDEYFFRIESDIRKIFIQFSKAFKYDFTFNQITAINESSLFDEVVKILSGKVEDKLSNTDNFNYRDSYFNLYKEINSLPCYFKKYQDPVTIEDLENLTNKEGVLNEVSTEEIRYNFLKHLENILHDNISNKCATMNSGFRLYVYYFKGKDFPMEEAAEYLKRRSVLKIHLLKWNSKTQHDTLFDIDAKSFDLWGILESLLPEKTDLKMWVNNNIYISYIEESDIVIPLERCYRKLLQAYSPILNITDNPGNLLGLKISEKIEQYKNKAS